MMMKVTQKTKMMASNPITSWQIDGETVETVADFIFLGSKITTEKHCCDDSMRFIVSCVWQRIEAQEMQISFLPSPFFQALIPPHLKNKTRSL